MKITESDVGKMIVTQDIKLKAEILCVHSEFIWVRYEAYPNKGIYSYDTWKREADYEFLEPRQKPSEKLRDLINKREFVLHSDEIRFVNEILVPALGKILDEMEEKK